MRNFIHDNPNDLAINSDTGQHLQFLRCFCFFFGLKTRKWSKGPQEKQRLFDRIPFVRFLWKLVIPELIGRVNEAETLTLRQNGLPPETHKREGNKENKKNSETCDAIKQIIPTIIKEA